MAAVEAWLRSLKLSNVSKAKMRNIMHAVFNHAFRWKWHERNPITHVCQSAKWSKVPIVLDVAWQRLIPVHWEGDLIIGKGNHSLIAVLVGRSPLFLALVRLDSPRPDHVVPAFAKILG